MRPTLASLLSAIVVTLAAARPARAAEVAFEVEVPAGTTGKVFVAASAPTASKAAWAPDEVELTADARGVFRGRATFEATKTLEWKVTRGDWQTVEKGAGGAELENRALDLGTGTTLARARVLAWADAVGATRRSGTAAVTSALVDLGTWKPTTLPARKVTACLPPGYEAPENAARRYPVLYVLDGQNQFDPARSFLGVVWRLDAALAAHVAAGREAFIAIAIDNTPERADEYLPWKIDMGGGRLDDLASFIISDLKPKIDARFRTRPDDSGILGSSFGGIAAFHLGWRHPGVFKRLGVVSPSLWVKDEATKRVIEATPAKPPVRIWLDMGTKEGKDVPGQRGNIEMARAVRDALVRLGFEAGKDLHYLEAEGARHDEGAWAARLPEILRFLFP